MSRRKEIWKDIPGYNGKYQVSNKGRIKRLACLAEPIYRYGQAIRNRLPEKIMYACTSRTVRGYLNIFLRQNGVTKGYGIHRLVAQAFKRNPKNLPEVNHKNGKKYDNRSSNLVWCTHEDNMKHAHKTGLINQKGESSVNSKLTEKQVTKIRQLWKSGKISQKKLSIKYKVCPMTICRIVNGKRWKHI